MIWKFNYDTMVYIKTYKYLYVVIILLLLIPSLTLWYGFEQGKKHVEVVHLENNVTIINKDVEDFTETALIEKIKDLNIKFPYIVLAQAMHETGNYESALFLQNHNLFGMKVASKRAKTSLGERLGHAYYKNWVESLYDYALWQTDNSNNIFTENAYYDLLSKVYAEDPMYLALIKEKVEKNNLKQLFND